MLHNFDHVTISVRDIAQATSAYQRLLGSPPLWRGEHPELGTSAAIFALRNACIELVGPHGDAPEAEGLRNLLAERGEGLQALALGTLDAQELSKVLRERGLRATPPQEGEARGLDGSVRSFRTVELSPRSTRGLSVFAVERPDPDALFANTSVTPDVADALDHVAVRTSDPEAALALYGQGLGIRLALDRQFGAVRMLFFRIGGVTLEVVHDPSVGASDAFYGLTFRVRDLQAAHARVQGAGFAVSELRVGAKPGTQVFTVRDGTCGVPTLFLRDPSRD
jgi:catechol 2,3-dioxygenase-like lactoylglutathione lyase family enzyme